MEHGEPDERAHVGLVRLRRERVPEEHDDVDLAARDHRGDLSIATLWSAQEQLDGESGLRRYELAGVLRRVQLRPREQVAIPRSPLQPAYLSGVVRDQTEAKWCS